MPRRRSAALLALVLVVAGRARAEPTRPVTFPPVVDYPVLTTALRRSLGMADGQSVPLWETSSECRHADVSDVALAGDAGRLRVDASGTAVVGFRLIWFCLSPVDWKGRLRLLTRPVVGRDWQLRLELVDATALGENGSQSTLGNAALTLARDELAARLRVF